MLFISKRQYLVSRLSCCKKPLPSQIFCTPRGGDHFALCLRLHGKTVLTRAIQKSALKVEEFKSVKTLGIDFQYLPKLQKRWKEILSETSTSILSRRDSISCLELQTCKFNRMLEELASETPGFSLLKCWIWWDQVMQRLRMNFTALCH